METATATKREHRSEEEIANLLSEYEASKASISVSEFCQMYDITEPTFYSWQKKNGKSGKFVPLEVTPGAEVPSTGIMGSFASILMADGSELVLHQYVEPHYLQVLLGKGNRP